ncbi:MAG: hypothetical protein QOE99_134 [Actinomycetota bacterium]|nr:hypothetical protein [Actinomycetota bacterium]
MASETGRRVPPPPGTRAELPWWVAGLMAVVVLGPLLWIAGSRPVVCVVLPVVVGAGRAAWLYRRQR